MRRIRTGASIYSTSKAMNHDDGCEVYVGSEDSNCTAYEREYANGDSAWKGDQIKADYEVMKRQFRCWKASGRPRLAKPIQV